MWCVVANRLLLGLHACMLADMVAFLVLIYFCSLPSSFFDMLPFFVCLFVCFVLSGERW